MATVRDFSPVFGRWAGPSISRRVPRWWRSRRRLRVASLPAGWSSGRNPLSRGDCRSGCCVLGARGGEGAIDHLRAGGGLPVPLSLEPSPGGGAVVLRGGRRQVLSRSACGDGANPSRPLPMQRTLPTPGTPLTKRRILCATELRYLTERLSRPEVELAPDEAARVADAFRRYLQRVGSLDCGGARGSGICRTGAAGRHRHLKGWTAPSSRLPNRGGR
jgi:hypothetical protein